MLYKCLDSNIITASIQFSSVQLRTCTRFAILYSVFFLCVSVSIFRRRRRLFYWTHLIFVCLLFVFEYFRMIYLMTWCSKWKVCKFKVAHHNILVLQIYFDLIEQIKTLLLFCLYEKKKNKMKNTLWLWFPLNSIDSNVKLARFNLKIMATHKSQRNLRVEHCGHLHNA